MKLSTNHAACSVLLIMAAACVSHGAVPRIKLTDNDRAAIIGSVALSLFKPGRNYEGTHLILADGLRAEWIPKISGYDVRLVTRNEIETAKTRMFYYVVQLRAQTRSVHVTVTGYDSETKNLPHVMLHYSYRRSRGKWRGKYLWGAGA